MKIKDIKIEALCLMFAPQGEKLRRKKLSELEQDERYRAYLVAMNGSINRCYADLEARELLWPARKYTLKAEDFSDEAHPIGVLVPLRSILPDLLRVDRVSCSGVYGSYRPEVAYRMEGEEMLLPKHDPKKERYTVFYRPLLDRVDERTPDYEEAPLSDRVAAWIPYFVAGELYREDEPSVAAELMARYNNQIEIILREQRPCYDLQGTVYSMTEG